MFITGAKKNVCINILHEKLRSIGTDIFFYCINIYI